VNLSWGSQWPKRQRLIDDCDNVALNKPLGYINQETFPLPRLNSKLRDISKELHLGHGFKVLRGLPVSKHTREDNVIIYAGVSSHVAPIRGRQDSKFEGKPADVVLNHIKDLSMTAEKGRIGAPSYTAEKQVFHTDIGDVISLLALSTSAEGGQSKLSSSWRVYNELAATRPDLIWTLSKPWAAEEYSSALRTTCTMLRLLGLEIRRESHTASNLYYTTRPRARRRARK
jgi:hypothetical protein